MRNTLLVLGICFLAAACAPNAPVGTFELTDDRPGGYRWAELAAILSAVAGRRVRPVPLPSFLLFLAAGICQLAAQVFGRAAILSAGKVREISADWSSNPSRQPPSAVWQAKIGLADGLEQTFARLRA